VLINAWVAWLNFFVDSVYSGAFGRACNPLVIGLCAATHLGGIVAVCTFTAVILDSLTELASRPSPSSPDAAVAASHAAGGARRSVRLRGWCAAARAKRRPLCVILFWAAACVVAKFGISQWTASAFAPCAAGGCSPTASAETADLVESLTGLTLHQTTAAPPPPPTAQRSGGAHRSRYSYSYDASDASEPPPPSPPPSPPSPPPSPLPVEQVVVQRVVGIATVAGILLFVAEGVAEVLAVRCPWLRDTMGVKDLLLGRLGPPQRWSNLPTHEQKGEDGAV